MNRSASIILYFFHYIVFYDVILLYLVCPIVLCVRIKVMMMIKLFEWSNGLDIALHKNIPLLYFKKHKYVCNTIIVLQLCNFQLPFHKVRITHINSYLKIFGQRSLCLEGWLRVNHLARLVGDMAEPPTVFEHHVISMSPFAGPWVEVVLQDIDDC